MPWVRLDEHALNHVKILALSNGAFRLWIEGLAHCQKHLTDGAISRAALKGFRYAARVRVDELTASVDGHASLWRPFSDGFQVHDYLAWNEAREHVLEKRQRAKIRMDRLRGAPCSREQTSERTGERPSERTQNESGTTTTTTYTSSKKTEDSPEALPRSEPADGDTDKAEATTPIVLQFPAVGTGGSSWRLRQAQVDEWQTAYPNLDVLAECRKALAWLNANPGRRKTAKGMPKFLNGWLSRAVDSGRVSHRAPTTRPQATSTAIDWTTQCAELHGGACTKRWDHEMRMRSEVA